MASPNDVKNYLAHWFQLGKKLVASDNQTTYHPQSVIQGDRFSPEFEQLWHQLETTNSSDYYLEGTDETIATLLSPAWEITNCSRCSMPVPIPEVQVNAIICPCNDLPDWPNEELPQPRLPINNSKRLAALKDRIQSNLSAEPALKE